MTKENSYFYGRVSTLHQDLNVQNNYADKLDIPVKNRLLEKVSGKSLKNRKLEKFIDTLNSGDILYVMKLDRLGRSLKDILYIVETCNQKGIVIDIGGFGRISNNAQSNLMLSIMGAYAQFERDMIRERMESGRQWQIINNPHYKEGRKRKLTPKQVRLAYDRYHEGNETLEEIASSFNVSKRTLQRRFKEFNNNI